MGDHMKGIARSSKLVFWHRELPPRDAEPIGGHTIEAISDRVPGTFEHRDDIWDECYRQLLDRADRRLRQEIVRLGGAYAHVRGETLESRRDDRTGEAWMSGQFRLRAVRPSGKRTWRVICRRIRESGSPPPEVTKAANGEDRPVPAPRSG